jgi:hypothetical protein
MKRSELNSLIYSTLREYSSAQVNLASKASAIKLAENISSAISRRFHVAKRRSPLIGDGSNNKEQLDLFEN